MNYLFYELSHTAGVPHACYIGSKLLKTDKQAIKEAFKKGARFIKCLDGREVKATYELRQTGNGAEFAKCDNARLNNPYFKYLFT